MSALPVADTALDALTCTVCHPPRTFTSPASADGHRRWAHPTTLESLGEECGPPPRAKGVSWRWVERLRQLDGRPGVWRRWPYSARSGAHRAAVRCRSSLAAVARLDEYRIEAHEVDGHWWVYGIRLPEELDNTRNRSTAQ